MRDQRMLHKTVIAFTICMSFHSDESVEILLDKYSNRLRSRVDGGLQVSQSGIQILVGGIRMDGGQEKLRLELLRGY